MIFLRYWNCFDALQVPYELLVLYFLIIGGQNMTIPKSQLLNKDRNWQRELEHLSTVMVKKTLILILLLEIVVMYCTSNETFWPNSKSAAHWFFIYLCTVGIKSQNVNPILHCKTLIWRVGVWLKWVGPAYRVYQPNFPFDSNKITNGYGEIWLIDPVLYSWSINSVYFKVKIFKNERFLSSSFDMAHICIFE